MTPLASKPFNCSNRIVSHLKRDPAARIVLIETPGHGGTWTPYIGTISGLTMVRYDAVALLGLKGILFHDKTHPLEEEGAVVFGLKENQIEH